MGQDMSAEEEEQFYYRHKVEVHLALVVVNVTDSSQTRFALQVKEDLTSLPNTKLKAGSSTTDAAKNLFKRCTGSNADWFVIKQVGVVEPAMSTSSAVTVLYVIMLPQTVPLTDESVKWYTYEELANHPKLLDLVGVACNYHRIN